MESVAKIIDDIKNASGRNDKLHILEANADNMNLAKCLLIVFNPLHKTNIAAKKLAKAKHDEVYDGEYTVDSVCTCIGNISAGNNFDLQLVWSLINRAQTESEKFLIESMATQKLSIGISASTINKAFKKDLIPTFGVMLAHKIQDMPETIEGTTWIGSNKEDGHRRTILKQNGVVSAFTRTGIPDYDMEDLLQDFRYLPDNTAYDCEKVVVGDFANSGEVRRATSRKDTADNQVLKLFDMLPIEDFFRGMSQDAAIYRKVMIAAIFNDKVSLGRLGYTPEEIEEVIANCSIIGIDKVKRIFPVEITGVYRDYDSILEDASKIWANGGEGMMVVAANSPYETKRVRTMLKVKKVEDLDLEIVGFRQGKLDSKYKDTLGALEVSYKGNAVGVSSGLSDELRDEIWNNKEQYLGKIAEVSHLGESQDENGNVSLFSPVFKGIRYDKEEADA